MRGKSVVYNFLGSVFDKGLPLIISILLTKFMNTSDYGRWSLFYTFMAISTALCIAPVTTIFSRKFFRQPKDNQKMHFHFYKLAISLQIVILIIYYVFFSTFNYSSFLEIAAVVSINLYTYLALFFRFKGWDLKYMRQSLKRLFFFAIVMGILVVIKGKISYTLLLATFVIGHIPSNYEIIRYLAFPGKEDAGDLKEFIFIGSYGLSSSVMTGIDKLIIAGSGFSLSFLGYYSFIYTLANTPGIIVDAFKKTITPIMYKDLTELDSLSKSTVKRITVLLGALLIFQFTVPAFTYFFLSKIKLMNIAFVTPQAYYHLFILSLGFFFVAIYQIVNPYYFFYQKSGYLLGTLILSLVVFFIAYFILKHFTQLNYVGFMWLKSGLLILITLIFLVVLKYGLKTKSLVSSKD